MKQIVLIRSSRFFEGILPLKFRELYIVHCCYCYCFCLFTCLHRNCIKSQRDADHTLPGVRADTAWGHETTLEHHWSDTGHVKMMDGLMSPVSLISSILVNTASETSEW